MSIALDQTIATQRCVLRAPSEADIPHILSATRVPGFTDGLAFGPHETAEGLKRMLGRNLDNWRSGAAYTFTIEKQGSRAFVGRVLVRATPEDDVWNLAFWIHPEQQGRGFATEAGAALVDFAFDVLGAEKIEAGHVAGNQPSRRVLEKLGMQEEGPVEKGLMKDGAWLPGFKMALTKQDRTHGLGSACGE